MTKYEIEKKILDEFAEFLPTIGNLPFDKALPKLPTLVPDPWY